MGIYDIDLVGCQRCVFDGLAHAVDDGWEMGRHVVFGIGGHTDSLDHAANGKALFLGIASGRYDERRRAFGDHKTFSIR